MSFEYTQTAPTGGAPYGTSHETLPQLGFPRHLPLKKSVADARITRLSMLAQQDSNGPHMAHDSPPHAPLRPSDSYLRRNGLDSSSAQLSPFGVLPGALYEFAHNVDGGGGRCSWSDAINLQKMSTKFWKPNDSYLMRDLLRDGVVRAEVRQALCSTVRPLSYLYPPLVPASRPVQRTPGALEPLSLRKRLPHAPVLAQPRPASTTGKHEHLRLNRGKLR
jgi:hypothetical protein